MPVLCADNFGVKPTACQLQVPLYGYGGEEAASSRRAFRRFFGLDSASAGSGGSSSGSVVIGGRDAVASAPVVLGRAPLEDTFAVPSHLLPPMHMLSEQFLQMTLAQATPGKAAAQGHQDIARAGSVQAAEPRPHKQQQQQQQQQPEEDQQSELLSGNSAFSVNSILDSLLDAAASSSPTGTGGSTSSTPSTSGLRRERISGAIPAHGPDFAFVKSLAAEDQDQKHTSKDSKADGSGWAGHSVADGFLWCLEAPKSQRAGSDAQDLRESTAGALKDKEGKKSKKSRKKDKEGKKKKSKKNKRDDAAAEGADPEAKTADRKHKKGKTPKKTPASKRDENAEGSNGKVTENGLDGVIEDEQQQQQQRKKSKLQQSPQLNGSISAATSANATPSSLSSSSKKKKKKRSKSKHRESASSSVAATPKK